MSGNHLFWVGEKGIGRANLNAKGEVGEVNQAFITGQRSRTAGLHLGTRRQRRIRLLDTREFGKIDPGEGIGRASVNGGSVEPDFMTGLKGTGDGLAVDGQHISGPTPRRQRSAAPTSPAAGSKKTSSPGPAGRKRCAGPSDRRQQRGDFKDASPGDGICAAEVKNGGGLHPEGRDRRGQRRQSRHTRSRVGRNPRRQTRNGQPQRRAAEDRKPDQPRCPLAAGRAGSRQTQDRPDRQRRRDLPAANTTAWNSAPVPAGSTIAGLQIEGFSGDGVLLEGEHEQLADSVLTADLAGAEVAGHQ